MFKKRPRPQAVVAVDSVAAAAASVGEAPPSPTHSDRERKQAEVESQPKRPQPKPANAPEGGAGSPTEVAAPSAPEQPGAPEAPRDVADRSRSLVCKMWAEKGVCKYGDGCQFAHIFDAAKVRGVGKLGKEVDSWHASLANLAPPAGGAKGAVQKAPRER